jgi:hypothetical protein
MTKLRKRNGHAPGVIRETACEAFEAWLVWDDGPEPAVEYESGLSHLIPISKAMGLVWNCTDIVPGGLFDELQDAAQCKLHTFEPVIKRQTCESASNLGSDALLVQHISLSAHQPGLKQIDLAAAVHLPSDGSASAMNSWMFFAGMSGFMPTATGTDRLVMIRIHDPGRHLDAGKIVRCPIRLRPPHLGDLAQKRIVFGRSGREFFILAPRPGDECGKNGTLIDILDAARVGICSKRKQFGEPLGVMDGNVEPSNCAITPADQRSLVDFEKIHEREHIGRHKVVTVGPRVARAAAVAAAVHDHDAVVRGQSQR